MDRKNTTKEIMELFLRIVNKYNSLEKIPVKYGRKHNLYHSERHMLDRIGDNPEMNITEFAHFMGVTKGAISQVVKKLEAKGVVRRYKKSSNDKEVFIELTKAGRDFYQKHQEINEETIRPLHEELKKYPEEKIEFLVTFFKWLEGFLDMSREKMKEHRKEGH
jgi:DNA-binding MarR family transcriptional regulator